MSIASELVSTEGNIVKAYDSLNKLGETATDKNIQNISELVDNIYAKFPKTEYQEGSNITLSNTLKGKLDFEDGIVGYGDISQKSYQGYNLLPSVNTTRTINGVTFTHNVDGSITANGTASANALYPINVDGTSVTRNVPLAAGSYVIVDSVGDYTNYFCQLSDGTNFANTGSGGAVGKSNIITLSSQANVSALVYIRSGITCNNLTFKPMIVLSTNVDKPYEPYVGGTASPNPSYPSEIKYVRGKNRFNENELEIGSIDVATGQNLANNTEFRTIGYIEASDVVTLSNYNYLGYTHRGIFEYDSNKNYIKRTNDLVVSKTTPFTLNLASNTRYIRIRYTVGSTITTIPTNMQIQLEKGSTATSYLPYNTLEVVERGKNEADPNNIILGKSLGTSGELTPMTARATLFENSIKPNTQYHLSIDNNYQIGNLFYYNQDKTYLTVQGSAWGNNKTTTTPSNAYYISFATKKIDDTTMTESDIEKLQIQIEEGSTATTYEPYQTPQTYQLSLGEYEFAKIGNYVDTIEYDVDEDKVYKNKAISKVILNGSETIGFNAGVFYLSDITNYAISNNIPYCTHFKGIVNVITGTTSTIANNEIAFRNNIDAYRLYIRIDSISEGNALKTWLSTNKPMLYYALATPTKTEITGTLKDQIKALYNSHSFTGTTIITSYGDLSMIIKVRGLKGE